MRLNTTWERSIFSFLSAPDEVRHHDKKGQIMSDIHDRATTMTTHAAPQLSPQEAATVAEVIVQDLTYAGHLRPPASFESRDRPLGSTHPSSRYHYSRHENGSPGPYISTAVYTNHESDSPPLCTIDIDPSQTGGYGFISMQLEVTDPRWLREAAAVLLDSADRLKSQQNAYKKRRGL